MKKGFKNLLLGLIGIFLPLNIVFATEIYTSDEAMQGYTLKVEIPTHNILKINGDFEGTPILFYEIKRTPAPAETISRAEFLEMMFQNHDFTEADYSNVEQFPDVAEDNLYYETIMKAAALGIINGYDDGNFRPYTPVTRGQIAKILVNAFAQKKVSRVKVSSTANFEIPPIPDDFVGTKNTAEPNTLTPPDTSVTPEIPAPSSSTTPAELQSQTQSFPDVPKTHRFYSYINQSVQAAWFKGYPDGFMRPDRHINYAEAEIVITRAAIPLNFTSIGEKPYYIAYLGIDRKISTGTHNLSLQIKRPNDTENKIFPISVTKRDVPVVRFSLPKSKTDLFGDDAQDKTWKAVYAALANPTSTQLWEGNFTLPTTGEITLGFGDRLYINGTFSGSHFGIDYANREGTQIHASNNGIVTLAQYTPAFGNTVVIDHGLNVFTMYLHMSELKTTYGTKVNKGDLIGLMGSTGISSGPHLHYTQFIGNTIVDSDQWIWGEI